MKREREKNKLLIRSEVKRENMSRYDVNEREALEAKQNNFIFKVKAFINLLLVL